jgi:hypothetical protein
MQPIDTIFEVVPALGTVGFSFLRRPLLDGPAEPTTALYMRDMDGIVTNVLIVPAAAVRRSF